ncbi:polyamine aminopropyltransferase [Parvularcula maris]|uniref:Polyamine aminopropyltransferase n=1 Tax=Parvularcula maris TaxID=2965077 RepID=A0A9X2RGR7_9PROT|nr:polyamine aminopropyltransferase [Parvularcula maris]MCQ8184185.1 polyamine aminopropyltransferase [Parvularcula maris]
MSKYLHKIGGELWFKEEMEEGIGHSARVDKVLFDDEIDHQHLVVFENAKYGRMFALNGIIQMTSSDEFVYHEMLTHVPLYAHGEAKRVLIIGGGDGGILREVLRHKSVQSATLVEIEKDVIEFARQWFPETSNGAFDDPRTNIVITDGAKYVEETDERFDVVIVDSTDPVGPGEVLFTEEFYAGCKRVLNTGGILTVQGGLPFLQPWEPKMIKERQEKSFANVEFYVAAVPTYTGGLMTLGFASDAQYPHDETWLARRTSANPLEMGYYTPEVHAAAFALPAYIRKGLE